jgi:hypothetical protein
MEGFEKDTDKRRGAGVHEKIQKTMEELRRGGNFFGASLTVTRDKLCNQHFSWRSEIMETLCIKIVPLVPSVNSGNGLMRSLMQKQIQMPPRPGPRDEGDSRGAAGAADSEGCSFNRFYNPGRNVCIR